ncbi:MAG: hypothetical protein RJA88_653 [Actinomycetota bacterium]|jgi:hypothetical protein
MKKFVAILSIAFLAVSSTGASAITKVTISPQNKVSKKNPVITVKVSGLPASNGIYLSQCMAPKVKGDVPTACNPSKASKLWISAVAADQQMGAKSPKAKLTMKLDKYFKDGDCVHTKCVIYVTADHNASDDRTEDQFIPFKFDGILPF